MHIGFTQETISTHESSMNKMHRLANKEIWDWLCYTVIKQGRWLFGLLFLHEQALKLLIQIFRIEID